MKISSIEMGSDDKSDIPKPASGVFFRYMRVVLMLGAVYTFPAKTPKTIHIKRAFIVLLIVLDIPLFCAFGYSIYSRAIKSEGVFVLSCFLFYLFSWFVISLLCSHSQPQELLDLENLFLLYEKKYKARENILKYSKHLKIAALMFGFVVVLLFLSYVYRIWNPTDYCQSSPHCDFDGALGIVVLILNIFLTYIFVLHGWGYFVICFLTARFLKGEFSKVSFQMKSLKDSINISSAFELLVDQHEMLTDLLKMVNTCFRQYILSSIYVPFLQCMTFLYIGLMPGKQDVVFHASLVLMCTVVVGVQIWFEAQVNIKAHEPLQHLWKLRRRVSDTTCQENISQFISRLNVDTVAYDVYGMFTIKMSTLLTLCGTLVTYIVVIVQFQIPNPKQALEELLKNLTIPVSSDT